MNLGRISPLSGILTALALSFSAPSAHGVDVASDLPFFLFAKTSQIPSGPAPKRLPDNCVNWAESPTTPGGRQVQNSGWAVTGEHRLGDYSLVTFAGEFTPGTSGLCKVQQGNIAVFRQGMLHGIIYTARPDDTHIGTFEPMEDGTLRLWSADYLRTPVGDAVISDGNVKLTHIRASDSYCAGKVTVPTVYGADISDARRALARVGWTPLASENQGSGMLAELRAKGILEAEDCSGTGLGHCAFNYENGPFDLRVITAGELYENNEPVVTWYTVDCRYGRDR